MSTSGELETEVCLPVRLEYVLSAEGELEITAVVPLSEALSAAVRIDFLELAPRERRSLLALVREQVEKGKA